MEQYLHKSKTKNLVGYAKYSGCLQLNVLAFRAFVDVIFGVSG